MISHVRSNIYFTVK